MSNGPITHIIFDLKGALIDNEKVYLDVIGDIVKPYGKKYEPDIRMTIFGRPEEETAQLVIKDVGLQLTLDEFLPIFRQKLQIAFKDPPLLPGAEEIVRSLHATKIPIALCTNFTREELESRTKSKTDLYNLFDPIVCGGSDPTVIKEKPAPDLYLIAARRFNPNPLPSNVLTIVDTPSAVLASKAAGMRCVYLPKVDTPVEVTNQVNATIKSFKEFKPELFGLPKLKVPG